MIFQPENIEKIVRGRKTLTSRLVKDGEWFQTNTKTVMTKGFKHRWQVGRDYAVQAGRGKKGVWYCPKCKTVIMEPSDKPEADCCRGGCPWIENKPLHIVIKSIHRKRLLDVTEKEAKREGYGSRLLFQKNFIIINSKNVPKKFKSKLYVLGRKRFVKKVINDSVLEWNPEIWQIGFEVKE